MRRDILDSALDYRRRGFSVIPIRARDKRPLIAWEQFQTEAASEDQIQEWFTKWPDANLAVLTGSVSDCVVIDLDTEEAKDKLKHIVGDYDLSNAPRSKTGKGWQLFFKHPGAEVPNRAGVIPGLDARGDGGYVVAPPSTHPNGKKYRWEIPLNGDLPALPKCLLDLIQTTASAEQGTRERFSTASALHGVPEGRRDEMVFKLACKLRRADVPQDMAETLVTEAARNCEPPFDEQKALEKVRRAYSRYEAKGQKQNEIWPELISAKDLLSLPPDPTRWIWDQCLPAGGASVLVSKPKCGKTHMAVSLGLAIARGIPFLGRPTQQSIVAYLSLDASLPEIGEVFQRFGLRESDQVFIHAGGAPVDAVGWLAHVIAEKGVRFCVIDTLQRLFRFQDVNDYSQVTNAIEPVLEAARQNNCHVLFCHHARKDSGDDLDSAIGSTAIRGLAYTYLHIKRLPDSERRIIRSDQRGGKNLPEMAIGYGKDGWLCVQGTIEEVEIEEAEPKILEFLQAQDTGVTEREILRAVNLRAIVISKAIRQLFKNCHIERTGRGKKGDPFRYSKAISLDSLPEREGLGGETLGRESEKEEQVFETNNNNSLPNMPGRDGKSWEENLKTGRAGRESGSTEIGLEIDNQDGWVKAR